MNVSPAISVDENTAALRAGQDHAFALQGESFGLAVLQVREILRQRKEALRLTAADIEATPDFGGQIAAGYIRGMAKVKVGGKVLLNINKVIAGDAAVRLPGTARRLNWGIRCFLKSQQPITPHKRPFTP